MHKKALVCIFTTLDNKGFVVSCLVCPVYATAVGINWETERKYRQITCATQPLLACLLACLLAR